MGANALFTCVVVCLMVHELDAIHRHEWRFFVFLRPFSDPTAYHIFTAAHAPLLVLVLWNLHSPAFQVGLDVFALVHAGLHWTLRHHPRLEFRTWFSWLWIAGAALLGLLHLILLAAS